jgi:hypothetical protein
MGNTGQSAAFRLRGDINIIEYYLMEGFLVMFSEQAGTARAPVHTFSQKERV